MNAVPYAAFGHVVFLCDSEADRTIDLQLDDDGAYSAGLYYIISGKVEATVLQTGERLPDRTAGWLNTENNSPAQGAGTLQGYFTEYTRWVCVPYIANPRGVASVSSFVIEPGATADLVNGSNIFIVDGECTIAGKTFTGPTQIRVRNGDRVATAVNKVLALRFEP